MNDYKLKFYFKNGTKIKARILNKYNLSVEEVLNELSKVIGENVTLRTKYNKLIYLKEVILIERVK